MKFRLLKVSDDLFEDNIEINTLEELINFTNENESRIILDTSYNNSITIFDDFL